MIKKKAEIKVQNVEIVIKEAVKSYELLDLYHWFISIQLLRYRSKYNFKSSQSIKSYFYIFSEYFRYIQEEVCFWVNSWLRIKDKKVLSDNRGDES